MLIEKRDGKQNTIYDLKKAKYHTSKGQPKHYTTLPEKKTENEPNSKETKKG